MFGAEACTRLPWNISTDARLSGRRDDADAILDSSSESRDGILVERPQRVGRRRLVMPGREHALLVARGIKHQRAVDRHHLVQEYRDVHCARLGHAVVARPGAVILMPLPDVALEGGLGVES